MRRTQHRRNHAGARARERFGGPRASRGIVRHRAACCDDALKRVGTTVVGGAVGWRIRACPAQSPGSARSVSLQAPFSKKLNGNPTPEEFLGKTSLSMDEGTVLHCFDCLSKVGALLVVVQKFI